MWLEIGKPEIIALVDNFDAFVQAKDQVILIVSF